MRTAYGYIPQESFDKAQAAYNDIITIELKRNLQVFQSNSDLRYECCKGLQMGESEVIEMIDGLDLLARYFGISPTKKMAREERDDFAPNM